MTNAEENASVIVFIIMVFIIVLCSGTCTLAFDAEKYYHTELCQEKLQHAKTASDTVSTYQNDSYCVDALKYIKKR